MPVTLFSIPSFSSRIAFSAITFFMMSSITVTSAQAGNMFVYKDNSGQVLLTNVPPTGNFNKFTQKVKTTYYPPSTFADTATGKQSVLPNYGTFTAKASNPKYGAYDHYIIDSARRHGVDPALMKAMMHSESSFNPNARSPVGAQGLMQLMPATARRFSVNNPWNPSENIEGAAKYIAWLNKRFNGNLEHVVAGYNAGEGNVDKYGGIPPFRETRNYVKKVMQRYNSTYKHDINLQRGVGVSTAKNDIRRTTPQVGIQRISYNGSNGSRPRTSFGTSSNYAQSVYDALR